MKRLTAACLALLAAGTAWAGPITPSYTTSFGELAGATFGGSGISNEFVAITTSGGVTLGLTATPRYSAPSVGNNGAGVFYATAGEGTLPGYALWNFDFYARNTGTTNVLVQFLYDFDPGVGTDRDELGSLTSLLAAGTTVQNSWNLGMSFLASLPPPQNGPTFQPFDPAAFGEYSFALILKNPNGTDAAASAINVNVGTVPDAASTAGLLLVAFAGVFAFERRRR